METNVPNKLTQSLAGYQCSLAGEFEEQTAHRYLSLCSPSLSLSALSAFQLFIVLDMMERE